LPNKGDAIYEHSTAILKIKEEKKLYKYSNGSFNKSECNYPMMEKILVVIRRIEKFLIFLGLKHFLFELITKEYLIL